MSRPIRPVTLERVFQCPSKYIQGPTAIQNAAKYLSPFGNTALVLSDTIVYKIAAASLIKSLEEAKLNVVTVTFNGEASKEEIGRIAGIGRDSKVDFIVAVGGGKTIDSGKATANALNLDVVVVPTIASTDAPCSALSVLYHEDGTFDRYTYFSKNPALVLVDTSIISKAPARFIASGLGDALATNVEARRTRNAVNTGGGLPASVSVAIGQQCEDILFRYGKLAYEANKAHCITPAFEAVVEANTLLSGLGFESGGLAAAHAIHDGLTVIHELHHLMHGEKVAFGIVCQLVLDNATSDEIDRYLALMLSVNLPVNFKTLGCEGVSDELLHKVAKLACAPGETIWNLDQVITEDIVYNAILGADAIASVYIKRTGWVKDQ